MNLALGIAAINNLSLAATDVHVEMTEGTRTVITAVKPLYEGHLKFSI